MGADPTADIWVTLTKGDTVIKILKNVVEEIAWKEYKYDALPWGFGPRGKRFSPDTSEPWLTLCSVKT